MIRAIKFLATVLLTAAFVTGCASRAVAPVADVDWQARDQQLRQLSGWEARGRIAIKAGSEGGSGNLQWQQQG